MLELALIPTSGRYEQRPRSHYRERGSASFRSARLADSQNMRSSCISLRLYISYIQSENMEFIVSWRTGTTEEVHAVLSS